MGQVWSKANFDGTLERTHLGGHGSVLAVTGQNPGPDGDWGTEDEEYVALNTVPVSVSMDATPGDSGADPMDRVRGFNSMHRGGASFVRADGSVEFILDDVDQAFYRAMSTIAGKD